jgi:hypothetical protein
VEEFVSFHSNHLAFSYCHSLDLGDQMCVGLPLPVHSLSFIKTPAVPICGGRHQLDTLRLLAESVGDRGADWNPRGAVCRPTGVWTCPDTHQSNPRCAGPLVCGHPLALTNPIPSYGLNRTEAPGKLRA